MNLTLFLLPSVKILLWSLVCSSSDYISNTSHQIFLCLSALIPNFKFCQGRPHCTNLVCWRLNSALSSWAKYHDICSLSNAFRAWSSLTDCLIHLCLTPKDRHWAGTVRHSWSISCCISLKNDAGQSQMFLKYTTQQYSLKALKLTSKWDASRKLCYLCYVFIWWIAG